MNAPSAWAVQQALSAWHSARERLLADNIDPTDIDALMDYEGEDVQTILAQTLRAAEEAKSMAEAADSRAKEIQERRDRFKRRAESLRGLAFSILDAIGQNRLVLPDLSASIVSGTPCVIISDEEAIADEYIEVTKRPNKSKIMADLKQGVVIEGAEISNGMPRLMVRTK